MCGGRRDKFLGETALAAGCWGTLLKSRHVQSPMGSCEPNSHLLWVNGAATVPLFNACGVCLLKDSYFDDNESAWGGWYPGPSHLFPFIFTSAKMVK